MSLPLELHWPTDAVEWAAWATIALVVVTGVYVFLTWLSVGELRRGTANTIGELREARFAEFLPMLRWQSPEARLSRDNQGFDYQLDVFLSNEGPGAARILDYEVSAVLVRGASNVPEQFEVIGIGRPSTMPKAGSFGDRIAFKIHSRKQAFEEGSRIITIHLLYGDLLGEFEYETTVLIEAYFASKDPQTAEFLESDERSALERRRAGRSRKL